ncbi:hypothetical protein EDC01DRAFT_626575 [Geopyxis carbonaria]|nr:hypothetical protein EDC01DRAFT_626575 [Geopyxis carbonaria]
MTDMQGSFSTFLETGKQDAEDCLGTDSQPVPIWEIFPFRRHKRHITPIWDVFYGDPDESPGICPPQLQTFGTTIPKHTAQQDPDHLEKSDLQPNKRNMPTPAPTEAPQVKSDYHPFKAQFEKVYDDVGIERHSVKSDKAIDGSRFSLPSESEKLNNPRNMIRQGRRSINDRARTAEFPDRRDRSKAYRFRPSFRVANVLMGGNCLYDCSKAPLAADSGCNFGIESFSVEIKQPVTTF